MAHDQLSISLPISIVSPTDIARLSRELEAVNNFFRDSEIRQPGEANAIPRLSKLMDQLAADNQLNLLQETDRSKIGTVLESLHDSAPVMHMSFSVDPPGPYVQKIVAWMRQNIHPQVLVTVGLQPNIGAGCIVRTTNKVFDFSLREYFAQKREFFIEKLHTAVAEPGGEPVVPVGVVPAPAEETVPEPTEPASTVETETVTKNESLDEQEEQPKPEVLK